MTRSLLLGTRKGLLVLDDDGSDLTCRQTSFVGAQVPNVCVDSQNGLWLAALNHGHFGAKVHRSNDRGLTWNEVATPTYPVKPDNVPDIVDPIRNVAVPWSLELIWCFEPSSDGRIWCGTIPGGLFVSEDSGDHWQFVHSLWDLPDRSQWFGGGYDYPGIHSVCVDPRDPQVIRVAISCGGVWLSRDGGNSWKSQCRGMRAVYVPPELAENPNVQDPHRMVQCPADPDYFWVQHHNGIFRSSDACQNWTECTDVAPSSFGFAVAVHPTQPKTAWFVPAIKDEVRVPVDGRLVVTRTTDGGQSFQSFGNGLPAENAYDLVYRHALAVDTTGQLLAMGSTTGNLWISRDGGESWRAASHHLPPIFSVNWA